MECRILLPTTFPTARDKLDQRGVTRHVGALKNRWHERRFFVTNSSAATLST